MMKALKQHNAATHEVFYQNGEGGEIQKDTDWVTEYMFDIRDISWEEYSKDFIIIEKGE